MLLHVPQALKSLHTRQLEINAQKLILSLFLRNIEEATEQWWSRAIEVQMSLEQPGQMGLFMERLECGYMSWGERQTRLLGMHGSTCSILCLLGS